MRNQQSYHWSRREFLGSLILAGTGALLGCKSEKVLSEPPPETTRVRLLQLGATCWAPQHVARELLFREGFTNVQYVKGKGVKHGEKLLKSGQIDISLGDSGRQIKGIEVGDPTVFISGLHVGSYLLISSNDISSISDLKGKTVCTGWFSEAGTHIFFSTIAAYVGLDPRRDINYIWGSKDKAIRLFKEGKIDAFMTFAPEPQELVARKMGHVLIDTNTDRPWSQYFCCMISGNREFIKKHPAATKRVLRALLNGIDITARDPELAARTLVERKVKKASEYDYILATLKSIPYDKWRDYDPEDTIRFFSLRMHEIGMIKSTPHQIIAQNTDWHFLREMKEELKLNI